MGNIPRLTACYDSRCQTLACCETTYLDEGPKLIQVDSSIPGVKVEDFLNGASASDEKLTEVTGSPRESDSIFSSPREIPSLRSDGSPGPDTTLKFEDGTTYTGQFDTNGCRHGFGESTSPRERYVGQWRDDRKDGEGQINYEDGRVYRGQLHMGMLNGIGRMEWPTPQGTRVFEGEYLNQLRHGTGRYIWADGRVYTGTWVRGKRWGKGTFTNPTGEERSGVWTYSKVDSSSAKDDMDNPKECTIGSDSSTMALSSKGPEDGHASNGVVDVAEECVAVQVALADQLFDVRVSYNDTVDSLQKKLLKIDGPDLKDYAPSLRGEKLLTGQTMGYYGLRDGDVITLKSDDKTACQKPLSVTIQSEGSVHPI